MLNYEAEVITAIADIQRKERPRRAAVLWEDFSGKWDWSLAKEQGGNNLSNAKRASKICSCLYGSVSPRLLVLHHYHLHLAPCTSSPYLPRICSYREDTGSREEWEKEDLTEETRAPGFKIPKSCCTHTFQYIAPFPNLHQKRWAWTVHRTTYYCIPQTHLFTTHPSCCPTF